MDLVHIAQDYCSQLKMEGDFALFNLVGGYRKMNSYYLSYAFLEDSKHKVLYDHSNNRQKKNNNNNNQ